MGGMPRLVERGKKDRRLGEPREVSWEEIEALELDPRVELIRQLELTRFLDTSELRERRCPRMSKRKGRIRYAPEFRRQMVELVRAGRTPEELAREFEPTANTIRKWVEQLDQDEGLRTDGLTSEERTELRQLRRKVKQLELEREILGKAAAWFARESITLPRPSDS